MRNFCIIANMDKANARSLSDRISDYLGKHGCRCRVLANELKKENGRLYYTDSDSIPAETECVIVLGGDGTMIRAAIDIAGKDIPLYGINLGGVGFLTESDTDSMWSDIDNLIQGRYRIEKRMMLKGIIKCGEKEYITNALNDVVISKREFGKLICFEVCINDTLLDTFMADGMIISTPTGSTGYNLSAGGPVMAPEMEAMVVTPVCPHSLNDRSFVISADNRINIRLLAGKNTEEDRALIIADGRVITDIRNGDILYVEKEEISTNIVLMEKTNFYHKMRTKLN